MGYRDYRSICHSRRCIRWHAFVDTLGGDSGTGGGVEARDWRFFPHQEGCLRRAPFFARQRKGRKKPPKGTFVVANLAGGASTVSVKAVEACKCSIAPPLRCEADASQRYKTGMAVPFGIPPRRPRRGLRAPPLDLPRGLRGLYDGRGKLSLNPSAFGR